MKNDRLRAVAFISDPHFGSLWSLLQPDFVTEKGQPIGRTKLAEWFWACWDKGHSWLADILDPNEYAFVFNGDLIEGNHHRTDEIWSVSPRDHAKAAKEALGPVARRAAKRFVVVGTECHVGNTETSIAADLGAEVNPEFGQPYWQRLALNVCGMRMSIRHHFPATARAYLEGSQHSIQLGNATVESVRAGDRAPDIVIGAHRHRTGHFCDGNRLTLVTGAWQGLTKHGFKVVPDGRPCPSIYVCDWRDKNDGELPAVHFVRFNPPPEAAVDL